MIRIENKLTGEVVETATNNWKAGLNHIKASASYWEDININTKASKMINNLREGYEDKFIKAYIYTYGGATKC